MRIAAAILLSLLVLAVVWTAVIWGLFFAGQTLDHSDVPITYLPLAFGILCALLWTYISVPLTLLPFGIRVPLGLQQRREALRRLGFVRFVLLYGMLSCGMAGFICSLMSALFDGTFSESWRVGVNPWLFRSDWRILHVLTAWLAGGVLFGWLTWNRSQSGLASSQ